MKKQSPLIYMIAAGDKLNLSNRAALDMASGLWKQGYWEEKHGLRIFIYALFPRLIHSCIQQQQNNTDPLLYVRHRLETRGKAMNNKYVALFFQVQFSSRAFGRQETQRWTRHYNALRQKHWWRQAQDEIRYASWLELLVASNRNQFWLISAEVTGKIPGSPQKCQRA